MKKFYKISAFLMAVLMLASCGRGSEEPAEPTENKEPATEEISSEYENEKAAANPEDIDRRFEHIYKNNPELTPIDYSSPAILPMTADMGQEYIDKLTVICDSQHYWMWPFGLLKDGDKTTHLWTGKEGTMTLTYYREIDMYDATDNTEKPLPVIMAEHKPEYCVIALGLNGIATSDGETFRRDYEELLTELMEASPDTKFICESILPIRPEYRNYNDINNVKITECNSWILEIAERNGARFMDDYGVLALDNGDADPELMMDDLHANKKGLEMIIEYWRTHAYTDVISLG